MVRDKKTGVGKGFGYVHYEVVQQLLIGGCLDFRAVLASRKSFHCLLYCRTKELQVWL